MKFDDMMTGRVEEEDSPRATRLLSSARSHPVSCI